MARSAGASSAPASPIVSRVWWPKTAPELTAAFNRGDLVESSSLELKRELPGKNRSIDLAIDVCAMTPDGGALIYGASDADGVADEIIPFQLQGQRDRVFQIVGSGISEVPRIDVLELVEEGAGEGRTGYLVVLVPASARAPHMVTIKGEQRYYGRNGTQNVRLGEGEVARLYERRERAAVDLEGRLDALVARSTLRRDDDHAALYFFVAPALGDDGLLERVRVATAVPGREQYPAILSHHLERARSAAPGRAYAPNTDDLAGWHLTSRGFCVTSALDRRPDLSATDPDSALRIEITYGGEVTIECGRAAYGSRDGGSLYIFEQLITGLTVQGLALAGALYDAANYMGAVDTGLAVEGLRGGVSMERFGPGIHAIRRPVAYDQDRYRRVARQSGIGLLGNPRQAAEPLVVPLLRTTIGDGHQEMFERFRP